MSSSKHAIIGTAITSVLTLLLTYFASVNFFCGDFNMPWLSNDLLMAVFGGVFASAFVVMLCEIQKYRMSNSLAIHTLYCNAFVLFLQAVIMQNTLDQYIKHPDEIVAKDALNNCIQKSFEITQNIIVCDYNPFIKIKNKLLKAMIAFRNEEAQIYEILNECGCYYKIAINNSMILHSQNGEAQNVFGRDELIQKTSRVLISRLETMKKICDEFLMVIDNKGKYQWNIKKQNINSESIDSIRALDLEEYIKKYSVSE